jgi:hypothetical protein
MRIKIRMMTDFLVPLAGVCPPVAGFEWIGWPITDKML